MSYGLIAKNVEFMYLFDEKKYIRFLNLVCNESIFFVYAPKSR